MILITGGTGHLGRDLVATLLAQHRSVRVLARSLGSDSRVDWVQGDLATGEGLSAAFQGVDTVIHAATLSPIAQRGGQVRLSDFLASPSDVDVEGTARLLEAAGKARVQHFQFVSIVGLEDSGLPYSRVKLRGEALVRESTLPWSVVRAMPFFYLLEGMLQGLAKLPVWPLPTARFRPVDTKDVAERLVELLRGRALGVQQEVAGPEALPFSEFARQYKVARGLRRPIVPLSVSQKFAKNMGFVPADEAWRGRRTWAYFLKAYKPAAIDGSRTER